MGSIPFQKIWYFFKLLHSKINLMLYRSSTQIKNLKLKKLHKSKLLNSQNPYVKFIRRSLKLSARKTSKYYVLIVSCLSNISHMKSSVFRKQLKSKSNNYMRRSVRHTKLRKSYDSYKVISKDILMTCIHKLRKTE